MGKATEIGKIVVNKCFERELFINTLKLQKLLFLMQIKHIQNFGFPLFEEDIGIWNCGIVIKDVNNAFMDSAVEFTGKQLSYMLLLEKEELIVDSVLDEYGKLEANEIDTLPLIIAFRKQFQKNNEISNIKVTDLVEWIKIQQSRGIQL